MECLQKFARGQQVLGIRRSLAKRRCLERVGLVNQKPAGFERLHQSREEPSLKKEKDNDEIVEFSAQIQLRVEVQYLGFHQMRRGARSVGRGREQPGGIFASQSNTSFGNIDQLDSPTTLRQPYGVPACAPGNIQGISRWTNRKELLEGSYEKLLRLQGPVRAGHGILLIPFFFFTG